MACSAQPRCCGKANSSPRNFLAWRSTSPLSGQNNPTPDFHYSGNRGLSILSPYFYFGQPIFFSSASGSSLASRAAGGNGIPFGTSQISTRRFLASPASTAAPLRSLGAVVEMLQEVGRASVSCVAPTQTPLIRETSSDVQVPPPPLNIAATLSTRS